MGSSKSVQRHASYGVKINPMGLWCRLFKCTLGGDMLLIYKSDEQTVYLVRLGSHAQLFSGM